MNRQHKQSALLAALVAGLASANAHAGGLSAGTSALTAFQVWFYSIAGILAICYLTWVGLQCWGNKADWVHDFGGAIAKVAAVGAATVLAPWAWTLFSS